MNEEDSDMDEIDEVTNRSGKPLSTLEVVGSRDPEPSVMLILRVTRPDGITDTYRLRHSPEEARRLSEYLLGTADAVALEALAAGGDAEAARLLAELKLQLEAAGPIPEWYADL
jgi:hypothetical protein